MIWATRTFLLLIAVVGLLLFASIHVEHHNDNRVDVLVVKVGASPWLVYRSGTERYSDGAYETVRYSRGVNVFPLSWSVAAGVVGVGAWIARALLQKRRPAY